MMSDNIENMSNNQLMNEIDTLKKDHEYIKDKIIKLTYVLDNIEEKHTKTSNELNKRLGRV